MILRFLGFFAGFFLAAGTALPASLHVHTSALEKNIIMLWDGHWDLVMMVQL